MVVETDAKMQALIVKNTHDVNRCATVIPLTFRGWSDIINPDSTIFWALWKGRVYMNKILHRLTALLLAVALLPTVPAGAEKAWTNRYSDLSSSRWSYGSISVLGRAGVLPEVPVLGCTQIENRAEFVGYLYRVHLALGGRAATSVELPFTDVPAASANYEAISWAWSKGVVQGQSQSLFAPSASIKRQDVCVILARFCVVSGLSLTKKSEPAQFQDSLKISTYARSAVTACHMAGLINGYETGKFLPHGQITREECLVMISRLYQAAGKAPAADAPLVDMTPGRYDWLYQNYTAFTPLVSQSAETELTYFDDVVFVGDSVSVMLQYYCASTKALGNAKFLCAGSLSATNALWGVSDQSVHPTYQGKKMLVEDGVAASGAKKVYIMLGINNIGYGVSRAKEDMVTLIDRILAKAPGCQIYIQSVTPMASSSIIVSEMLNNDKIVEYNNAMLAVCEEKGWYFVNVAEVFRDENGCLPTSDCSDNGSMGIHFTNAAAEKWVEYLKTHTKTP